MEIAKAYNPKEAEENHYKIWESRGCFAPEINENPEATPFTIVIPPPNVTGSLHMGHALQHTIMDVLARRKRMLGFRPCGCRALTTRPISVQRKIVEQLRKRTKTSAGCRREEFLRARLGMEKSLRKHDHGQMRREGASVDWSRERFHDGRKFIAGGARSFCAALRRRLGISRAAHRQLVPER
jgi:valyl-tRNA synthetase